MNMMQDMAQIFADRAENYDYESFSEMVMTALSADLGFDEEYFAGAKAKDLAVKLHEHILETYQRRMDTMVQRAWPIIKQVYETQAAIYTNIAIPISDGRKMLTLSVDLKKAYESEGREIVRALSKTITLWQIDEHWKEHLRDMDDLKQSVQNATYEQKDPLLIYKFESFNLFSQMLEELNQDVLSFLLRAHIPLRDASEAPRQAQQPRKTDMSHMQTSRNDLVTNGGEPKSNAPVHVEKQVGRNDPCPCGSGKKFKNCHGKGL
jgi:preprotein translocase subunit SecA